MPKLETFATLTDAAHAFRRSRTVKWFTLECDSPDLMVPCTVCGRPVGEFDDDVPRGYRGNRGQYDPRTRRFRLRHYLCGWESLMAAVGTSCSLAEAADKLDAEPTFTV